MATQKIHEALLYARNAGADLSGKLNYFAKIDTDGDIVLAGDGEAVAGNITEAAAENSPVTVQFGGIGKVICAEAITPGARIASDADGKAVVAAVNDFEAGTALGDAASTAGDVISFIWLPGRRSA